MAARAAIHQQSEDDLAKDVAAFLRLCWPPELPWWHTPNGGKREQVQRIDRATGRPYWFSPEAAKLKEMGVLAGVPDLTFVLPNAQVAFIELKVGDNQLSPEQEGLRAKLLNRGCGYAVCYSLDEVEATLRRWLAQYPGWALRNRPLRGAPPPTALFGGAA
jgi:hypothetical protein